MVTREEVGKFLHDNKKFSDEYFLRYATPKLVEQWVMKRSHRLSVPDISIVGTAAQSCTDLTLRPCTSYLSAKPSQKSFVELIEKKSSTACKRKKKTAKELFAMEEKDLLMELIRDIAYELDIDAISHKILVNVCILTNCDRSSLFLCKGHKDRKYLVSRLFDVTRDSTVEEAVKPLNEAITIPFGVGIAGHSAAAGEVINIINAYEDSRFNPAIDKETGYKTHSILCMPIKNQDGQVIGVAQIINKKAEDQHFTRADEEIFNNYLIFCGIGLTNAQLYESSVLEYKRNRILLGLAKNIFEDTECLETVVRRIMTQAVDLMNCERCTVYIIDHNLSKDSDIIFSKVFDLIHDNEDDTPEKNFWQFMAEKSTHKRTVLSGFAMLVVGTGEILNIDNFTKESYKSLDGYSAIEGEGETFKARCMLCCPIFNNQQDIIGVAQLFNKNGCHSFDDLDETMFEGFSTFCGLGIHNTQMYEKANLMAARQKVNLEVLQYHASAGPVDVEEFGSIDLPEFVNYDLHEFSFDDIILTEHETCLMAIGMFLEKDLLSKFRIPEDKMVKFILSVKKNYRPVIYHNWRHAFNVAQTMFSIFYTGQMYSWMSNLEVFVLLVACLCHDLDHRGTNNTFQVMSESPIATLYGTSTMERHHFDHSVMLLQSEGSDIFSSLDDDDYESALEILEDAILSTDLTLYFKKRSDFIKVVETQEADWSIIENRGVLRGMLMTVCDIAAITKPWATQQRVAEMVAHEFFQQGDLEKTTFSRDLVPMMDREKHKELPKMQVGFIDFVCMPLYRTFYHINPLLKPLYDGVVDNRKKWQHLIDNYVPEDVVIALPPNDRKVSSTAAGKGTETHKNRSVSFAKEDCKICTLI